MKMPFIDLKAQYTILEPQIKARIEAVLFHGQFIMGPEIAELEKALADFSGAKYAVACSSGTDALILPLLAYNIGPGDAVFTTPFTFYATAEVIALLGATPVFVDVDQHTMNICSKALEKAVFAVKKNDPDIYPVPQTKEPLTPKGIIAVDIFGLPADYHPIMELARRHDLFVIEDAAQSFGSSCHGKKTGNHGHVAATSFFPAKPLGGYGDGGAMFTNDETLANTLRSLLFHGKGDNQYENIRIGINGRLDTLQAAVLLPKLEIFPKEKAAREQVAKWYTARLKKIKGMDFQSIPSGYTSAWAQYSITHEKRNTIQKHLTEADIPSAIYYPRPLHVQPVFSHLGYKDGDMPVSHSLSQKIISLPMHPYLKEKQVEEICNIIVTATK